MKSDVSQTQKAGADPLKVMAISGSLRAKSLNSALLRAARDMAPEGLEIEVFDLSEIPFFNQDVESSGLPHAVKKFQDTLTASDAVLIATPEYNFSTSGLIKSAIEWASRPPREAPLRNKPVAIMGASPGRSGTARAQGQLRQMLAEPGAVVLNEPEMMVSRAYSKFDESGLLVDDQTAAELSSFLSAFSGLIRRTQAGLNYDGRAALKHAG